MNTGALLYPPIARGFLALFEGRATTIVWENPSLGVFGVVVPAPGKITSQHFSIPCSPPFPLEMVTCVQKLRYHLRSCWTWWWTFRHL